MATPVAVFAGYNFTFVLDDDGTFTAFGDNSHGQLGEGGPSTQTINLTGIPPTAEFGNLTFKQGQIINLEGIAPTEHFGNLQIGQNRILNLMGIPPTEHFGNLTFRQVQPPIMPGFNYSFRLASKHEFALTVPHEYGYRLRLANEHNYSLTLPGRAT
jgi:hypothetical protein